MKAIFRGFVIAACTASCASAGIKTDRWVWTGPGESSQDRFEQARAECMQEPAIPPRHRGHVEPEEDPVFSNCMSACVAVPVGTHHSTAWARI
jgi:hypothetical protein